MGKFILKQHASGYGFTFVNEKKILMQSCRHDYDRDDCLNCIRSLFLKLTPSSIEDCTLEEAACFSDPKFKILFNEQDGYSFRITDADGGVFARSAVYPTKLDCINAIDAVIKTLNPIL